ncbi:MAG: phosphoglycerate mutase [Candidatus Binatia bacterium]|nr:MAG: phosphoglycerate mutase [Candidatus Binatia bacterium]
MGSPTRILLVRHGESEGNRDAVFTASPDVPLTARGHEQARRTAEFLRRRYRPVRLLSSPYRRAYDTARVLSPVLGLEVEVDERFREQSFGIFAGRPYASLAEDPDFSRVPRWSWKPPGGESLLEVRDRAGPALDELVRAAAGSEVVLVCHGGVIRALWAHVHDSWEDLPPVGNGAVVEVSHAEGRYAARVVRHEAGSELDAQVRTP